MVYQKLCKILAEQFDVSADSIRPETNIVDDLGADSLDVMELISNIEEEFDIVITDERIREKFTVAEVAEFLEDLIG